MSENKDISVKVIETSDGEVIEEWSPETLSMASSNSSDEEDAHVE